MEVGFSRWDQLTREEKGLIESTVQRGWETNRAAILREAAAVPGRERWCSGKAEAFPEICRALEQAAANPVARATGGAVR